jgi:sugar phosphate isomerase/epimerase
VIEVGIFAKTFPGTDPFAVFAAARGAGYRVVQYNMACSGLPSMPDAISSETAEAVAAAANEAGVSIAAVSSTYNMIHPDSAVRERGLESLGVIAAAAHAMGTQLLTLSTGTRDPDDQWRKHPDNDTAEAWRDLLQSMEAAIGIANRHDIDLGIEPEHANVVDSTAQALRLIKELQSPRLKIVLDPANLFETATAEERRRIIAEAIDSLADRIVMAHAKDRAADGSFVTAGKGVIDYAHYLRRLGSIGFEGPLVAHGLDATEAPGVAKWLKTELTEAGLA